MHIFGYRVPPTTPAIAGIFLVLAFLLSGVTARMLKTNRIAAGAAIAFAGLYCAVTLAAATGRYGTRSCAMHLSRPFDRVDLSDTQQRLNVLLLLPLGVLVAWGSRRATVTLVVLCLVMPPTVEFVQMLAPSLRRACDLTDVENGYLGVFMGVVIAGMLRMRRSLAAHLGRHGSLSQAPPR